VRRAEKRWSDAVDQLEFEREKWRGEYDLRKRELELKERDAARSQWSSPLVIAVSAAAVAGLFNAGIAWVNGMQARTVEETKGEAARILEVIRTDNPDKAAVNLKFLVDAGLISDAGRRKNIQAFLDHRAAGQGPTLPTDVLKSLEQLREEFEERAKRTARDIY
jgi:hypothetical protein